MVGLTGYYCSRCGRVEMPDKGYQARSVCTCGFGMEAVPEFERCDWLIELNGPSIFTSYRSVVDTGNGGRSILVLADGHVTELFRLSHIVLKDGVGAILSEKRPNPDFIVTPYHLLRINWRILIHGCDVHIMNSTDALSEREAAFKEVVKDA